DGARAALDAVYKDLRRAYGVADLDTIQFGVELGRMARQAGDLPAARRLFAAARARCPAPPGSGPPLAAALDPALAPSAPGAPGQPRVAGQPRRPAIRADYPDRVGRARPVPGASPASGATLIAAGRWPPCPPCPSVRGPHRRSLCRRLRPASQAAPDRPRRR